MRYWLMKSEPDAYSIDQLAADKTTAWTGIRNYQARNFMRDQMSKGDRVFFYHSNCNPPGIIGVAEVCKLAYPDETQFDPNNHYFDSTATRDQPRWLNVDIRFIKKNRLVSLDELRQHPALQNMRILARGNRLSITPVDPAEWQYIEGLF
jgi:predicted RNA-binding protein with PUA-like domain